MQKKEGKTNPDNHKTKLMILYVCITNIYKFSFNLK